ncbi:MAG: hypothetical protein JSU70_16610 [Phycisphaerales bacterium]|nr:MAG: hypothetical protein JSU70_16610 [Phycisphaerales bacterium]
MKPIENTENFVRRGKAKVTTGPRMDKRVLDDSFAAMDKTLGANKTNAARMILRSRLARLAAAAVIIVAVGLLMVYRAPVPPPPPRTTSVAKSPAEMLTAMSLNLAWRRGGIEAVDEQTSKAFEMLGSQSATVSIHELLAESNGV